MGQTTISAARQQIGNHAANDGNLGRILLAEESFIGFGGDEQLGDDRSDAAKMAGAGDAVKTVSEVFDFDKCGAAGRVHFFDGWGKDDAGTVSLSEGAVSIQGAWVAGEVLAGTELGGVDENADGDVAAGCARGTDERSVAGMERTHGGHESDRVAGGGFEETGTTHAVRRRYEGFPSGFAQFAHFEEGFRMSFKGLERRLGEVIALLDRRGKRGVPHLRDSARSRSE